MPLAAEATAAYAPDGNPGPLLKRLDAEMKTEAKALRFERAAQLRDRIKALKQQALEFGV